MKNTYYLYNKLFSKDSNNGIIKIKDHETEINQFKIGKNFQFIIEGEKINIMLIISRLMFFILSFGKARIFYCKDKNNKIIHESYVIPKCRKFPFLNKNDFEIGPCYTDEKYRGLGIYPNILNYITTTYGKENSVFYMVVFKDNNSSIRGIEKAGFNYIGEVEKTWNLKYIKKNQK